MSTARLVNSGLNARLVLFDAPAVKGSPWLEWVRWHGIDSRAVLVPGWVRCSDVECTVTYTTRTALRQDQRTSHERVSLVVVQLEAPAMPFPESEEFSTLTLDGEWVQLGPAVTSTWLPSDVAVAQASPFGWLQP